MTLRNTVKVRTKRNHSSSLPVIFRARMIPDTEADLKASDGSETKSRFK